jgi:RHS repeat-associated protein
MSCLVAFEKNDIVVPPIWHVIFKQGRPLESGRQLFIRVPVKVGDPCIHKTDNRTILDPSGRVRLGLSFTTAGSWDIPWPIRVVEKTRSDTRPYGLPVRGGTGVAAHPVAQLAEQIIPARPLKQTTHRPHPPRTHTFHTIYDSLYRLTEAVEKTGTTQNWIQNWNYDRYGNRSSFTQNIAGNSSATNPTVDQNTNRFNDSQGFVYDNNGNVIHDVDPVTSLTRTFVFNGDNKQSEVKNASGGSIGRYFYDGEGNRVKKVVGDETTVFVYSSGKLVAEYSTHTESNPAVNYTTSDHLGSPRIITDQYGQVTSRRDFMPFGEQIETSVGSRSSLGIQYSGAADGIRQKFTGYQKDDETSLDFAAARMYENRYGRFTAVDPLLTSGTSANPQTFNRYSYTSNNPVIRVDVNGTDWVKVKNVHLTYGKTYTSWQPVWKEGPAGSDRWNNGAVYRIGWGKNRGKWAALDPWGDHWTLADTKAGAMSAYEGYQSQMRTDVAAGAVSPLVNAVDGADLLINRDTFQVSGLRPGLGTAIRNAIFGAIGRLPDEESGPYRSSANLSSIISTTATFFGGEGLSAESSLSTVTEEGGTTTVWSKSSFEGTRVFQRNDIFDPNVVSGWLDNGAEVTGTNVERMASGRAPIGTDGEPVNLHHLIQTDESSLAEMTSTFHRTNSRIIHINPRSFGSGIDRPAFNTFRSRYWMNRATGF